jgi:peptide chain release factor 2
MENYEVVKYLDNFKKRINDIIVFINVDRLKKEIIESEKIVNESIFWDNPNHAKKVIKSLNRAKEKIEKTNILKSMLDDLALLYDFQKQEDIMDLEIDKLVPKIELQLNQFETELLLSSEYDDSDAIMEIHPGAGGTESQDWASMLYRMYKRFSEMKNFGFDLIDYQEAEEAGIKSVTFIIKGKNSYGLMKSENGVHRLVRISPFDSNARRHTSFASVSVTPVISNDVEVDIKPEDIKVDTYRSSGAGGQSVNTTDSAVRITHLKTGIVVTCQNQRSQIQNRETAMQVLKSRIYQVELQEKENKIKSIGGDSLENTFGSQIRSYTLQPYALVKDHRTQAESSNPGQILDGDIGIFIDAYLKSNYNK